MIVALAVLVALAVPAALALAETSDQTATADRTRPNPPQNQGPLGLGLSTDQLTQLKAIRDNYLDETADLRTQAFTLHDELRDLRRDNASQDKIDAKQAEIAANQQAQADKALTYRDRIKAVLTAEQLSKLEDQALLGLGLGMRRHGGRFGGECPWGNQPPSSESAPSTDSGL